MCCIEPDFLTRQQKKHKHFQTGDLFSYQPISSQSKYERYVDEELKIASFVHLFIYLLKKRPVSIWFLFNSTWF